MRKFIYENIMLIVFIISIYFIYYKWEVKDNKLEKNYDFYIWGDSQTAQGIDIKILEKNTNLSFYSMAVHGASLYDFSCFANLVPRNSKVIVGISSTILLRPDSLEYNRTNLDFNALRLAKSSGFSISYIKNIFLNNLIPSSKLPKNNRKKYIGSLLSSDQADEIKKMFFRGTNHLSARNKYFYSIIEELKKKSCSIIIIQIPQSKYLKDIEFELEFPSTLKKLYDDITKGSKNQVNLNSRFSDSDFYDITHLNQQGSIILTEELSKFINSEIKFGRSNLILLSP